MGDREFEKVEVRCTHRKSKLNFKIMSIKLGYRISWRFTLKLIIKKKIMMEGETSAWKTNDRKQQISFDVNKWKTIQIISYHIILYHIIPYQIILYHIISYHIILYHIILYHIISYHIISYCRLVYHVILYHIISYHIISTQTKLNQMIMYYIT